MSEIKTLFRQSSHYLTGQVALMAVGFISFPILTRIFSVADYGHLSLIVTTLFILTAIVKFGLPNSIVRFYAEHKASGTLDVFASTSIIGSIVVSILLVVPLALFALVMKLGSFDVILILLVSLLLMVGSVSDVFTSFLRAEQKTKTYNALAIVKRYGTLLLGVVLTIYWVKGVRGFFLGQLLFSIVVLLLLFFIVGKKFTIKPSLFSLGTLKVSALFGVPLVWAEFGHLILNYIDRYLIQYYLGAAPLGIYTAGYNLATHIAEAIIYPINYAMTPVYMSILVNKGTEETQRFFSKMFKYFLLVMIPVVFGVAAVGKGIISVLASSRYQDASLVLIYVIIGQAVYACTIILNSGLFISKKTHVLNKVMMFACVVNVALNVVMIPKLGIEGAAIATLISYILYAVIITHYSFKEFSFNIEFKPIIRYVLSASIMYLAVAFVKIDHSFIKLLVQVILAIIIYSSLILIIEKELRYDVMASLRKYVYS